ncbi:MAG: histidine phosphatase family protein [Candidatus Hodarchaeales archaeon]|jgi:probable phosphoglycerate mutase
MNFYLIRHGESLANKVKVFQGWTDVSLSKKGHKQAKNLGLYFVNKKIRFAKIYTSPLKRAIDTGQHLLQCSDFPELITIKGLRSINVGQWAGWTVGDVDKNFKHEYRTWKFQPKEFCFPKGESIADVQLRAKASLFTILEENQTSQHDICIVTHMITIKVLILLLLNIDLNSIWEPQYTIPNTGIVIFEATHLSDEDNYRFRRIPTETSTPHLI